MKNDYKEVLRQIEQQLSTVHTGADKKATSPVREASAPSHSGPQEPTAQCEILPLIEIVLQRNISDFRTKLFGSLAAPVVSAAPVVFAELAEQLLPFLKINSVAAASPAAQAVTCSLCVLKSLVLLQLARLSSLLLSPSNFFLHSLLCLILQGLQAGDLLVRFGSLTSANFSGLAAVGELVRHSEGVRNRQTRQTRLNE